MTEQLRFVGSARRAAVGSQLAVAVNSSTISVPLSTYGAGDVVGIDPHEIIRRVPAPGSAGHPPNMFPFVDLRHVDYPWRVSPGGGRLSPWLVLVVFEGASVQIARTQGAPLPSIDVDVAALPSLAESHAWAHGQFSGDPSTPIETVADGQPERCLARLVCARQLAARTQYVACLVPAFESGRLAGLGKSVPDPHAIAPAWTSGRIELPVYDSWTFTTGEAGDFETLARRLKPADLAARARPWEIDVAAVAGPGTVVAMPSALRPVGAADTWSGPSRDKARSTLAGWLAAEASATGPVIGPPLYGGLAAGTTKPVAGWLDQLACDPRFRAVASLGAGIVRRDQETLVGQAWDQIGHLRRVNRERDGAALSELVVPRLAARHLAPAGDAVLTVARAAWQRVRSDGAPVAARVAASMVPVAIASPAFRKLATARVQRATSVLGTAIATANARTPALGVLPPNPAQLITPRTFVVAGHSHPHPVFAHAVPPVVASGLAELATRAVSELRVPRPPKLPIGDVASTLVAALSVSAAPARFRARFDAGDLAHEPTPTAPLVNEIDLPYVLSAPLAALDRRYLVGGVDVPLDSVGLLELDPRFVEAALIGASHELVRELQWRGAPVDRRITPFKQFFDARGTASESDIPGVAAWQAADALGDHVRDRDAAVVVVRGELIRRFPDALIYVAKAQRPNGLRSPSDEHRLPRFRGALATDAVFVGLDLSADDLRGTDGLGWYVVIAEHAGGPRFGLDEARTSTSLGTWNDLSWGDVTVAGGYVAVQASTPAPTNPRGLIWGRDGGHMAGVVFQRPVSIAIHAAALLPARST